MNDIQPNFACRLGGQSRRRFCLLGQPRGLPLVGVLLRHFRLRDVNGYSQQEQLNQEWQQESGGAPRAPPAHLDPHALQKPVKASTLPSASRGWKYFAAVREGVDTTAPYSGPGHIRGLVARKRTVGVAAHNVYWINFRSSRPGMRSTWRRATEPRYRVTGSKIVNPDEPDCGGVAPGRFPPCSDHLLAAVGGRVCDQALCDFADQFYPVMTTQRSLGGAG